MVIMSVVRISQYFQSYLKKQTQIKFNTKIFLNNKWPSKEEFAWADGIVVVTDGDARHVVTKTPQNIKDFETLLKRKIGVVFIHYATVVNKKYNPKLMRWIGGFYDRYKKKRTLTKFTYVKLNPEKHPINNGVMPYVLFDEIYYRMTYDKSIKPVAKAVAHNSKPHYFNNLERKRHKKDQNFIAKHDTNPHTIFWSFIRSDGGRSVGTTYGHIHHNIWSQSNIRKQLLNAVAWSTGCKVPTNGLNPLRVSKELMFKNHSKKKH